MYPPVPPAVRRAWVAMAAPLAVAGMLRNWRRADRNGGTLAGQQYRVGRHRVRATRGDGGSGRGGGLFVDPGSLSTSHRFSNIIRAWAVLATQTSPPIAPLDIGRVLLAAMVGPAVRARAAEYTPARRCWR